ncbi:hypothetical protein HK405_009790, partial [Cladochytrium tenue]
MAASLTDFKRALAAGNPGAAALAFAGAPSLVCVPTGSAADGQDALLAFLKPMATQTAAASFDDR